MEDGTPRAAAHARDRDRSAKLQRAALRRPSRRPSRRTSRRTSPGAGAGPDPSPGLVGRVCIALDVERAARLVGVGAVVVGTVGVGAVGEGSRLDGARAERHLATG